MSFLWLKHYMPRSLYGRAALILLLPVVVLTLVVSVAFIQNHLQGIIRQMTGTVQREITFVTTRATAAPTREAALEGLAPLLPALQMQLRFVTQEEVPERDQIRWYDFSGGYVRTLLRAAIPEVRGVRFNADSSVQVFVDTGQGPLEIGFSRSRVTVGAPHQLIVTMLFFALLMTVIAFLYLRNQLRPITRLADAAQAFGRGRAEPYRPGGAMEVRAAGSAFLDMRARIERQIEQRTLMLSGVSHDLRTPLTRLKLGLSMLDDEEEAAPLLRDVDDMQRLLDTFLEFSRGAAAGEAEPTDPLALVRGIVADAQRADKPVQLGMLKGAGEVLLKPLSIRRAVENLIDNAVRYGSQAVVSVTLSDKALLIQVEDDGPGIPPEQREEALIPFARLDPARNQNRGSGVGLGLAIAKDVARAHGGALRLGESEALGGLKADIVIGR
ncbi:ATP-binding protein [Antarcticimicrobium sediminis]|uniref:histidine kinase n=1 Tax=Antarcticimicrobium sediminis TaxID=2546227 RepID=A0A4R5EUM4_9RHOB|nr:ATP-binding protein [Antarcticimicrobium sediminis]TDE38492.1 HAMP domain-containing protein [Antarcticimicrobium sediminis]